MPIPSFGQDYRKRVTDWAYSQEGLKDPKPYWLSALGPRSKYPPHWCGAFALAALHAAGLATHVRWQIGDGFLLPVLGYRAITRSPMPGDIAYFDAPYRHHAVVGDVEVDGAMVELVNGNSGWPPHVRVTRHLTHGPNAPSSYFSIEALIDRARAEAR